MSNGNTQWITGAMSRQRHGGGWAPDTRREDSRSEGNSALWRIIKRLDVYARIDDDLQVKTETGAAVTIGFWILMIVLVIGEVQAYMKVQPAIEHVVVDSTMGQRVRINADIVSANLPFVCAVCTGGVQTWRASLFVVLVLLCIIRGRAHSSYPLHAGTIDALFEFPWIVTTATTEVCEYE